MWHCECLYIHGTQFSILKCLFCFLDRNLKVSFVFFFSLSAFPYFYFYWRKWALSDLFHVWSSHFLSLCFLFGAEEASAMWKWFLIRNLRGSVPMSLSASWEHCCVHACSHQQNSRDHLKIYCTFSSPSEDSSPVRANSLRRIWTMGGVHAPLRVIRFFLGAVEGQRRRRWLRFFFLLFFLLLGGMILTRFNLVS